MFASYVVSQQGGINFIANQSASLYYVNQLSSQSVSQSVFAI